MSKKYKTKKNGERRMSEYFLTVKKVHECQCCMTTWCGTPNELCSECRLEDLERQLEEASKERDILKGYLELASSMADQEIIREFSKACLKQLKEKGDE